MLARDARLGRRAAGALRRRSRACCRDRRARTPSSARRAARPRGCRSAGSRATSRRRSTGRAAMRPGEAQGDLRHRQLRARPRRRRRARAAARPARRRPPPTATRSKGAVLVSGAAVQWLRDGLGVLASAAESEALARSVDVDRRRRLRAGAHRARLTLVGRPMRAGSSAGSRAARRAPTSSVRRSRRSPTRSRTSSTRSRSAPTTLRADGGAAANGFLMQLQADLLGMPVEVAAERETTALGAAALAGRRAAAGPGGRDVRAGDVTRRGARIARRLAGRSPSS